MQPYSSTPTSSARAAAAAYAQAASADPLTAPHAELAFEVLSTFGEGGMGTVYEVRDKRTGRLAALKRLPAGEDQDGRAQRRFLREATLTAKLDHPSIPPVYEVGRSPSGELYMLLRAVRGRTLKDELKALNAAPLSERRPLIEAVVKVAEALAYAHSRGIVHRDLKPSNVMIGEYGEVLLIDWGIARDLSASGSGEADSAGPVSSDAEGELAARGLTLAGAVVGTLGYMAPEQALGQEVDERADVYALGLLLGEVLTGAPLIAGAGALELQIACAEGRTRWTRLAAGLPPALRWVVDEALAPDLESRTTSAGGFARQLRAWLAGALPEGYEPRPAERLERLVRGHPSAILIILAGLVVFGMSSLLGRSWEESQRREAALVVARGDEAEARARAERAQALMARFKAAREQARSGHAEGCAESLQEALRLAERSEEALMTAAEVAVKAGLGELARELLTEVSERFPPAYEALYQLHELEAGDGVLLETAALRTLLERSVARGDRNAFTDFFAGLQLHHQGRLEAAREALDAALAQNRKLAPVFVVRGRVRFDLGDVAGARDDLERAAEVAPTDPRVFFERAAIWQMMGDLETAERDLDRAIGLAPDSAAAFNSRGNLRLLRGQAPAAIYDFERAIALRPHQPLPRTGLALALQATGDIAGALRACDEAVRVGPSFARAYGLRGSLRASQGDVAAALKDFDEAIRLDPRDSQILYERSLVRLGLQELALALEDLERCLALSPALAKAHNSRGLILWRFGRQEQALEAFGRALEADPSYALAYSNRGTLRMEMGDNAGSLRDHDRAIALDASQPRLFIDRGNVKVRLRDRAGAREDFSAALRLDPRSSAARYNRASQALADGDLELAREDLEVFLEVAPEHAGAPRAREKLEAIRRELSER